jgi:hypothetical protein
MKWQMTSHKVGTCSECLLTDSNFVQETLDQRNGELYVGLMQRAAMPLEKKTKHTAMST